MMLEKTGFLSINAALKNNLMSEYADILQLLEHEIFKRRAETDQDAIINTAYDRFKLITKSIGPIDKLMKDPNKLLVLHSLLASVDPTLFTIVTIHYNICAATIWEQARNQPYAAPYIKLLEEGEAAGTYLLNELGFGNNAVALKTVAEYDPIRQVFILNTEGISAAKFMPHTAHPSFPKIAVVMARLKVREVDYGIFPFLFFLRSNEGLYEGVRVVPVPGRTSVPLDHAFTFFENVILPYEALLTGGKSELSRDGVFHSGISRHRERFKNSINRVQPGKLCLCLAGLGIARAALSITTRYASQRLTSAAGRITVRTIDYIYFQEMLAEYFSVIYAFSFWVNKVAAIYVQELDASGHATSSLTATTIRNIAITKASVLWGIKNILSELRERCGAQGVLHLNYISEYISFLQGAITAEGDCIVIMIKAARELLEEAGDLSLDPSSFEDGLDQDNFSVSLFYNAECSLKAEINAETERLRKEDQTTFQIWNAQIPAALQMARYYSIRSALQEFRQVISKMGSNEDIKLLKFLMKLYGLSEILREGGWFVSKGLLSGAQLNEVQNIRKEICKSIAPHLVDLAAAFDIPTVVSESPLASKDYLSAYQDLLSRKY